MKKIGLLGGTFDPIHNGHIELALASMAQCNLDRILLIPAGSPPHKSLLDVSPFHYRYEMVKLACRQHKDLTPIDIEKGGETPSFTIDTVEQLIAENSHSEFFFIIGEDAFVEFETWKDYRKLLIAVSIILCSRKMFDKTITESFLKKLGYEKNQIGWLHGTYKKLYKLDYLPVKVSSTMIRDKVANGTNLQGLMPDQVEKYIIENKLYTS